MDLMTVLEIATAILLAEAVITAVHWAANRRPSARQPPATGTSYGY